jgi:Spy/CpxP family protein refolding chaperone
MSPFQGLNPHFDPKAIIMTPLRGLKKQQTIVQKLDALSAQTQKLEAIYQQQLNDLDELKKSILQKAFNGGLNTENPEGMP